VGTGLERGFLRISQWRQPCKSFVSSLGLFNVINRVIHHEGIGGETSSERQNQNDTSPRDVSISYLGKTELNVSAF